MNNNIEHIDDDFLKKLIGLQKDEKTPEGFTGKVMSALPEAPAPAIVSKERAGYKLYLLLVAIAVAMVLIFFNIDFGALLNFAAESEGQSPQNYLNMFSSVLQIFSEGFSGIKVTSITVMAVVSLTLLYFIDWLLKNGFNNHQVGAA
jgi:hypothetical protein